MFRITVCENNPLDTNLIISLLSEYQAKRPGIDITADYFYLSQRKTGQTEV